MLRKLLISLSLAMMFTGSFFTFDTTISTVHAQPPKKPVPEYAKWGRLAMKKTQKRYPMAQLIDYLHMGRDKKNGTTIERFKIWMRQGNREFGAFVTISFDTKTEEVKNILIVETDR